MFWVLFKEAFCLDNFSEDFRLEPDSCRVLVLVIEMGAQRIGRDYRSACCA